MTRRIALAILGVVLTVLIATGVGVYWQTRAMLLENLDLSLSQEALSRADLVSSQAPGARVPGESERIVIHSELDRRRLWRESGKVTADSEIVARTFTTRADGVRMRTVTLRVRPTPVEEEKPQSFVITFSGSAEEFYSVTHGLAWILAGCGAAGAIVSGGIAHVVASRALRPLRSTADQIGTIDEKRLDLRVDAQKLPPELQPMAERLNQMLERLQQAFSQRRQFLADASHELRTPVAALLTTLEVSLARPREADSYRRTLDSALGDVRHLRRLVEGLMEQVRSERYEHEEAARRVDVSELVRSCVQIAAALGQDRGIGVRFECGDGIWIQTQPGRLRSVISNILSNAVYYNRPGGTVEVSLRHDAEQLIVTVRDSGVGISADKLPHIFEPFYRADEAHQADEAHLGLGLFLVRSHLDRLGGKCSVQSEVGRGTEFQIELPGPVERSLTMQSGASHSEEVALIGRE